MSFWNPNSCKREYRKKAAHLLTEECEEIIDNKTVSIEKHNKTLLVKKKYNKIVSINENMSLSSCKPFIFFLLVNVIITGLFVYFYVNSQSKRKFQDYY